MKKQPGFVLVVLILIASVAFGMNNVDVNVAEKAQITGEQRQIMPQSADLVSHEPIYIDNDGLLASYASSGDGSLETPYIIENWNITTPSTFGIRITATTKYFIIRNCWITTLGSVYHGISLEFIAPGTVKLYNNTCLDCGDGIYLFYSDGVIIENNTCNFNGFYGIQITDSNYVVVRNNICNYNDCGIEVGISPVNCVLENNICMKNYYGIRVIGSLNSLFTKNYIANNTHGLECFTSDQYWCNQSEFMWNKFLYNLYQGLELYGIYYYQNNIHHNWFVDNYVGYPQVMDGGGSNHFELNYWNTWTGPDVDNNGIVDVPYMLDSIEGNADYKPLTVLYEPGIYFSHDPIYIDGNTDFNDTALLEGWFGDGSDSNPFMIQQYQIYSLDYAITIINTDYYFILLNCECIGGLWFSLVSNGQIINNCFKEIAYPAIGMAVYESINCNFSRNVVQSASGLGAQISAGSNLRIVENLFQDTMWGVQISDCTDSKFSYNNIVRTTYGYYGLEVNVPINTIIMYNNYADIGSAAAGASEIYSYNGFDINQGNNWYSSAFYPNCDLNYDGFVDAPHYIGGGYYDYYPLTSATTMSLSIIQYPTAGSIVAGIIPIKWTPSVDLWNHPVTYSVYYLQEGYGFTNLVSGLTIPSYSWDTASVVDGYYRLMVVAQCANGIGVGYVLDSSILIHNTVHDLTPAKVLYPNGGETVSDTTRITWEEASDSWGDSIVYYVYYLDGYNSVWNFIGQTTSSYLDWYTKGAVPNRNDYLIRVVAECSQGLITEDLSDNYFSVQNVHLISFPEISFPNGGETVSNTVQITWTASTDTLGHSIFYEVHYWDGSTWIYIGTTSDTYIYWSTNGILDGSWYRIHVVAICSDGMTEDDVSNTEFTVLNGEHTLSSPQILSPNGGETLIGIYQVSWVEASDTAGHSITYSVYYSSGNSGGWVLIGSTMDQSYFFWNTQQTGIPDRSDYRVKVIAACNGGLSSEDVSDNIFKVSNNPSTSSTSNTMSSSENPFADLTISGYDTYLMGLSFLLVAGIYLFFFKKSRC